MRTAPRYSEIARDIRTLHWDMSGACVKAFADRTLRQAEIEQQCLTRFTAHKPRRKE